MPFDTVTSPLPSRRLFPGQTPVLQSTPSNPTGTSDLTGKMMGFAIPFTPQLTGRLQVSIDGNLTNALAINGAKARVRYGTGAAPANGDAPTGTVVGSYQARNPFATNDETSPFHCGGVIQSLALGVAIWMDLDLAAITAGTAAVQDLAVTVFEV